MKFRYSDRKNYMDYEHDIHQVMAELVINGCFKNENKDLKSYNNENNILPNFHI